jgi:nitrite reductase/ring-hydroxylating ferredoxin subunit/uncharacterized membrane protein
MTIEDQIIRFVESQAWLETASQAVQRAVRGAYESAGPVGLRVRDVLHGVWQGHPVHAVVTDITVGAYSMGVALDVLDAAGGPKGLRAGADATIGIGVASAGLSALAGITDWQHTNGAARRMGLLHALLNTASLALFIASLAARKRPGGRAAGRGLALGGLLLTGAAGWLGGHLAYGYRIGMNHAPTFGLPTKFTALMAYDDLPEGKPVRAMLDTVPVLLVRRGAHIHALAETCAHLGGPLSEGKLTAEGVVCPWHGSHFALEDGRVLQGPSVYAQPCFETRVRKGMVEVRHRPNANTRDQ